MKKTVLLLFLITGISLCVSLSLDAGPPVTVHFFESAVCPSCAQAKRFFDDYADKNNIRVIQYEVRNSSNIVDKQNMANINRLVSMLKAIDKRLAKKPFIYDSSMKAYPFYTEKGVPYYKKRISKTLELKKELPVPVFIIGDSVVAGFQKSLLIRLINQEKNR